MVTPGTTLLVRLSSTSLSDEPFLPLPSAPSLYSLVFERSVAWGDTTYGKDSRLGDAVGRGVLPAAATIA